jgi:putative DNA primase/helicase
VNFAGELPESGYISGAMFKQIVGGDEIQVERKNEQPFEIRLCAMHCFASNYLPRTKDISEGFSRRWLILEFKHPVPRANLDLNLAERIVADEAEAFVAWAVEGYIRLRDQKGYTIPASHEVLVDRMNSRNSSLYYYLSTSQTVIVGRTNTSETISAKNLYDDYNWFCADERIKYRLEFRSFQSHMDQFAAKFDFECCSENGNPFYRHIKLKKLAH